MKNDFFSLQSKYYSLYRPIYPESIYQFIRRNINKNELAWDVATGNGQAAFALAQFFDKVYATDISLNQLQHAKQHQLIEYHLEPAEASSLRSDSVDLITVATAIHWFKQDDFFREVDRVLKHDGLLFAWSYGGCKINESIDEVVDHFNFVFLLDYWPEGAKVNWVDRYQTLKLPFKEIATPIFVATAQYNMYELMNYMFSWSGVQEYIKVHNKNPLLYIEEPLLKAWGNPNKKIEIKWPLHCKCSRK